MSEELRAREAALACANEACRNMDGELDLDAMTKHFLSFASSAAGQREGRISVPRAELQKIADRDFNCSAHQHGMAAAGVAERLLASPAAPEKRRDEVKALKDEIIRQCGIGAGDFYEDRETGLWMIVADLDPAGLRAALTPAPGER